MIGKSAADRRYAEVIKPIRNKLRAFNHDSAIEALSTYLNVPIDLDSRLHLQRLPWVAERLAVWLMADSPSFYGQAIMREADVRNCVGAAWDMADELFPYLGEIEDIHLFVRRQIISQAPYQTSLNVGAFGRQLLLLSKAKPGSKLRKALDQNAGMPVEQYFEMAILLWSKVGNTGATINQGTFNNFKAIYGADAVDRFQRSIALPKQVVQEHMRSSRIIGIDEWYQPTLLYKYPCLTSKTSVLTWGAPTVRRHLESIAADWLEIHKDLSAKQQWEKLFSDYIGESLRRTERTVLNEQEIQKLLRLEGKVCDFLLEEAECVVLIEVKHKSLTGKLPASSRPQILRSKLKETVVKGIDQLATTARAAINHPAFQAKAIYRVIVTSGELWLGPGNFLRADCEDRDASTPHIFSADDLDHLCELARIGRTCFKSYFEDLWSRNQDPMTAVHSPGFLLHKEPYILSQTPEHLRATFDPIFDRIKGRLEPLG